jgi:aryl-alcohol dehydrogenase-like predicted oxidoreductase
MKWLEAAPRRSAVTAPIIGARTVAELEANLGAAGWRLTEAQMERLNQASDPGLPYPYDMIAGAQARR